MHDLSTYLLLFHAHRRQQQSYATDRTRAARFLQLRRVDRQAERAVTRARLLRLA
jgi:hypothetical protein